MNYDQREFKYLQSSKNGDAWTYPWVPREGEVGENNST